MTEELYVLQNDCMFSSCHVRVSEWIHTLNVKELLAQNMCKIWNSSDGNCTRTLNHLVRKGTLKHLAKLAYKKEDLRPVWLNGWEFVYELSGCGLKFSCSYVTEYLFFWKRENSLSNTLFLFYVKYTRR